MTAPTVAFQKTTDTSGTLPASGTVNVATGDLLILETGDEDATVTFTFSGTAVWKNDSGTTVTTFVAADGNQDDSATNGTVTVRRFSVVCNTGGTFSVTASNYTSSARRFAFYVVTPPTGYKWGSARRTRNISDTAAVGTASWSDSWSGTNVLAPGIAMCNVRWNVNVSPTVNFGGGALADDEGAGTQHSHIFHALFDTNDAVNSASSITISAGGTTAHSLSARMYACTSNSITGTAAINLKATHPINATGTPKVLGTSTINLRPGALAHAVGTRINLGGEFHIAPAFAIHAHGVIPDASGALHLNLAVHAQGKATVYGTAHVGPNLAVHATGLHTVRGDARVWLRSPHIHARGDYWRPINYPNLWPHSFTTYTTPNGTVADQVQIYPNGTTDTYSQFLLMVPHTVKQDRSVPIVLALHGLGDTDVIILPGPSGGLIGQNGMTDAWLDAGWVIMSGQTHGQTWGNELARLGLVRIWDWAQAVFQTGGFLIYGLSMGAASGLNFMLEALLEAIPQAVTAYVGNSPAVNYRNCYTNILTKGSIKTVYALSDACVPGDAEWVSKIDTPDGGHDPQNEAASAFPVVPMRFYVGSSDVVVNGSQNGVLFNAKLTAASWTAEHAVVSYVGGHGAPASFQPSDTNAFYQRALAADPLPANSVFGSASINLIETPGAIFAIGRPSTGKFGTAKIGRGASEFAVIHASGHSGLHNNIEARGTDSKPPWLAQVAPSVHITASGFVGSTIGGLAVVNISVAIGGTGVVSASGTSHVAVTVAIRATGHRVAAVHLRSPLIATGDNATTTRTADRSSTARGHNATKARTARRELTAVGANATTTGTP